jgi:hypothetical protein
VNLLQKLRLSWNSGLADWSLHGPLRMAAYQRCPLPPLLRYPRAVTAPDAPRSRAISCRFGIGYSRNSVGYQRRAIRDRLGDRMDTSKLPRRGYFQELKSSKIVVSPFGFGEITLKDFEVFLTGGLLMKPDMKHLETWPDLFRVDETMLVHAWDLSDFESTLERAEADYHDLRIAAERGQERFVSATAGPQAASKFVEQFLSVVD